jgi:hypothetical protein
MPQPKKKSDRKAALAAGKPAPDAKGQKATSPKNGQAERPAPEPSPLKVNRYDAAEAIANRACGMVQFEAVAPRTLNGANWRRPVGPRSIEYGERHAVSSRSDLYDASGNAYGRTAFGDGDSNAYLIQQARAEMGDFKDDGIMGIAWRFWNADLNEAYGFYDGSMMTDAELEYGPGTVSTTRQGEHWLEARARRLANVKNERPEVVHPQLLPTKGGGGRTGEEQYLVPIPFGE